MKLILSLLLLGYGALVHAVDLSDMTFEVNTRHTNFQVVLPANPTTGYQWSLLDFDKKFLRLKSHRYQKGANNLIGGGGHMIFIFSLIKGKSYPTATTIIFKYARPWDKNSSQVKNVNVHFMHFPDE